MRPLIVRDLLVGALHRDPDRLAAADLPNVGAGVWDDLLELAVSQRVRPLLYYELTRRRLDRHVPPRILEALVAASRQTAQRNLRFLTELGEISRALAERDAPVVALKGAHLMGAVYPDVGLREMSDLDVLVRPDQLALAVDAIQARGYRPTHPFRIRADIAISQHLTRFTRDGRAPIEVHWNITPPLELHAIDPEDLWHRVVPWTCGGVSALGLGLEDLLLHLCFHASFQHQFQFVGLRPLCDIAAVLDRPNPRADWDVLVHRARAWRWTRGVYLALRLARDLVGAAVPAPALDALRPSGLDDAVLEAAEDQLFAPRLHPGVARLAGDETVTSRLRHLGRRVFLSRPEPPADAPRSPRPDRPIRSVLGRSAYLLRRHSGSVLRLVLRRDPALTAMAERTNRIRSWLETD